ncbi:TetR/AcrR family transcriptional regulator [Marinomonas posidonica]|uniref:Regulatory protein TetR n=1 Tax=Marinomonas posidonica (strain CECT 7376 / NCIMB 14433 / IVIA-Po-181) TaxID=491952 RepID=F6CWM8_MARPP|nr:helix-turn-helix domain-containing protein [Marinomonas posidonica]AEF54378.1 regulatory protein TetR [Marinomonas posidonica IVIA-Po-181]
MSRKRNTDHETALTAAKSLFWQHGYTGTSTRDIEEQTGLTRFTIQKTYGGKRGLFLDTLDNYLENAETHLLSDIETGDLEDLACWFERLASNDQIPSVDEMGCLVLNSIDEFGREDIEVNERIDRYFKLVEQRFINILSTAVTAKNARLGLDIQSLAIVLIDLLLGVQMVFRARTEDSFARSHACAAATLVRSWKIVE